MSATVVFIPHGGGPMPLMNDPGHANMNRFLRGYAETIPRPDAIVVISAHWEEAVIGITASAAPPLLFDYYNFPPETYEYQYPALGHPELAAAIHALLSRAGIEANLEQDRGLDHGVFVPLLLMFPQADIPCVQISLSSSLDGGRHVQIGQALSELKNENLLIIGSGFSFHNMQALMRKSDDSADTANHEFEAWLEETCTDSELSEQERTRRLIEWELAPHARYCHPREEHLLPLQVCYGIAQSPAKTVFQQDVARFLTSGYEWR